ncbi:MAG: DUF881 domain-containing protein [Clostridiales bacterium]|nr:DUF881 domain-containing protein [Clostridiales bacterium]
MKQGKKKRALLVIFCFAVCFALILVTQTNITDGKYVYVSSSVLDYYETTIAGEQQELDNIQSLIRETEAKIEGMISEDMSEEDAHEAFQNSLISDVNFYGMASGEMAVRGPGITVTIDDSQREIYFWESPNDVIVHDQDLLLVLNELKLAGAEAISINGQRIVDETSISCSGYTVSINGRNYARPFVIRAVGDGARMSAALLGPGCYGTILRDYYGLIFEVSFDSDMIIPAYSENRTYDYLEPVDTVKEGESN